jgi:tetratricopeptide (TPR) repeat protein
LKKILFLLVFLFFTATGSSQKLKTYYINFKGEKTSKLNAKFKRTIKNKNTIWVIKDYYLNDSIKRTVNFLDKKLTQKTGEFMSYYPNGKLSQSSVFKNNHKHGDEISYYITGVVSRMAHYNMGEATGKWIWYDENGEIENELDNVNPKILNDNYSYAEYPGGKEKLYDYINKVDYELRNGNKMYNGKTITAFQISEEGDVADIDIIVHGTEQMDSAIIKHLNNMPKWKAAKKNGKYVTSNHVIPIRFGKKNETMLSDKIVGEAFFNSGGIDYKEGKYEKAVFKFKNAIGYNHMEAKYYFFLGHSYYNLNKQDFACSNWTVANSLDSEILKKEIKDLCNLK